MDALWFVGHLLNHHQIVPVRYDVRDENSVRAAIANSNVIVNCIGRHHLPLSTFSNCNSNFQIMGQKVEARVEEVCKETSHCEQLMFHVSLLPVACLISIHIHQFLT